MNGTDITGAYQRFNELQAEIDELNKQISVKKKEQAVHEAVLLKGIKEKESKFGIQHVVFERKTPRYKDILQQARERFIPKTKQAELDVIIEEMTTVTKTHKFELEA